jgi:hypothetical protein
MASKQLGIKEVLNLNVSVFSSTGFGGNSVFYADYASETSIETTAERLDLRGGQGNYKLLSFDHTKESMLKTTLPLVDLEFVAFLTGKALVEGAVNVPTREVGIPVTQTFTLTETPVAGSLKIYKKTDDRDNGDEQVLAGDVTATDTYTLTGDVVLLNATTAPDGTEFICTYDYLSPITTRTITMTADKFAQYVRITGQGIVTDQVTGSDEIVTFDFKKCKPQGNFTLTQSSTSATTLEITFDLFSINDGSDKVYFTMHELV